MVLVGGKNMRQTGRNALQRLHMALPYFCENMHICAISHTAVLAVSILATIQEVSQQ